MDKSGLKNMSCRATLTEQLLHFLKPTNNELAKQVHLKSMDFVNECNSVLRNITSCNVKH